MIPEKDKIIVNSLTEDLNAINAKFGKKYVIRYQDWHDDSECDEWGTYKIINTETKDSIGAAMSLNELDHAMCVLDEFVTDISDVLHVR